MLFFILFFYFFLFSFYLYFIKQNILQYIFTSLVTRKTHSVKSYIILKTYLQYKSILEVSVQSKNYCVMCRVSSVELLPLDPWATKYNAPGWISRKSSFCSSWTKRFGRNTWNFGSSPGVNGASLRDTIIASPCNVSTFFILCII